MGLATSRTSRHDAARELVITSGPGSDAEPEAGPADCLSIACRESHMAADGRSAVGQRILPQSGSIDSALATCSVAPGSAY